MRARRRIEARTRTRGTSSGRARCARTAAAPAMPTRWPSVGGRCPIQAGVLGRLADHECRHVRLPWARWCWRCRVLLRTGWSAGSPRENPTGPTSRRCVSLRRRDGATASSGSTRTSYLTRRGVRTHAALGLAASKELAKRRSADFLGPSWSIQHVGGPAGTSLNALQRWQRRRPRLVECRRVFSSRPVGWPCERVSGGPSR
jgi:hypothetical protein